MNNENIVPITYNGEIIGYTDPSKTPLSITPIDGKSREILEELMSSPIYISSRQQGKIDENGYIHEKESIEYSVNKFKQIENEPGNTKN
jgi:hypothetical protein